MLVHDLTGGNWMASGQAGSRRGDPDDAACDPRRDPGLCRSARFYSWTHPAPSLGNTFYLNQPMFYLRYGVYVVLWNLLAAFAFWAPRGEAAPIPPGLSWISGIGLVVLAFSTGFAAIDWILSLEPNFWSSVFSYIRPGRLVQHWACDGAASCMCSDGPGDLATTPRPHGRSWPRILLATTMFWAYIEFMQFLIIWEENLKSEIPYYLHALPGSGEAAMYIWIGFGFIIPFFVLLWRPSKRNRAVVATICGLLVLSRVADIWWLVLPEFPQAGPFWLDVAAIAALGGAMVLIFAWAMRFGHLVKPGGWPMWKAAGHG